MPDWKDKLNTFHDKDRREYLARKEKKEQEAEAWRRQEGAYTAFQEVKRTALVQIMEAFRANGLMVDHPSKWDGPEPGDPRDEDTVRVGVWFYYKVTAEASVPDKVHIVKVSCFYFGDDQERHYLESAISNAPIAGKTVEDICNDFTNLYTRACKEAPTSANFRHGRTGDP